MFIFLYGSDTLRSRQHLKKMIIKFKADRDPDGMNVVILDCSKETSSEIWNQILSAPFLAEKRLLVLENLLTSKHGEIQVELTDRIKKQNLWKDKILIFWENTAEFKTKDAKTLATLLEKEKYSQLFTELKGPKLNAWIKNECEERGGKIAPQAVQYLSQNAGYDNWYLNSLIDQLISYKNGEEITSADLQLFLREKSDDNIFNLIDAIVGKYGKQVYTMIEEQYKKGEDANYIFSMLLRQFRILLQLRSEFEKNDLIKSDDLAKKLNLHPFVVKKSLPLVKRYTMAELKNIYQQLLELDTKIKTSQGEPELLLDLFVGKLTSN